MLWEAQGYMPCDLLALRNYSGRATMCQRLTAQVINCCIYDWHCCLLCKQVWDNDGDFLLIEAAYVLPRWLKPETARYRVWLRGGALHVIPLPPSPALPGLPAQPNLHQALDIVASGRVSGASGVGV